MSFPYLILNDGSGENRHELTHGECVLGRHPECHVVIEVGAVSRRHARIIFKDDGYFVEDLKSRNKTFLNEEVVRGQCRLKHKDHLRICDAEFVYCDPLEESSSERGEDGSSSNTGQLVVDDSANSTVLSKLDVSSSREGVHLTATADAKLTALLKITRALSEAVALDQVLPKVLDSLFEIFIQADRAFVILADDEGNLTPRFAKMRRDTDNDTLRISSTVVNLVMDSKQAVLSADASSDTRFDLSESLANFSIRSMMCVPLIDTTGDVLGALQIDTSDQKKKFEKHDLEVLSNVAAQAAIAIEKARLHETALKQLEVQRDLEFAKEVQHSFLPDQPPNIEDYDFFDYYCPASHIGGDYYDYIPLPEGRVAVLVADVVGHGVAAALLMAKLSAEARYWLASRDQLDAAVTQLNEAFCRLSISRFATMVVVALDPEKHELTIVNCGHMPPMIRRPDGTVDELGGKFAGIPIGINDDAVYEQFVTTIQGGETVLLYTDGLNEAADKESNLYGIPRIREFLAQAQHRLQRFGQDLIDDVRNHLGSGDQEDDMCLVCFHRRQPEATEDEIRRTTGE